MRPLVIKSSARVELESDVHERLGVGFLADSLKGPDGSNNVVLLLMENAPEPWEVTEWKAKNENSSPISKSDS
jgi:hypothetical protein